MVSEVMWVMWYYVLSLGIVGVGFVFVAVISRETKDFLRRRREYHENIKRMDNIIEELNDMRADIKSNIEAMQIMEMSAARRADMSEAISAMNLQEKE